MLPILQIGPLAVPTSALILLLGFWIGIDLTEKHARRYSVEAGPVYNTILIAVAAGILGARLTYAAQYPAAFLAAPLTLLSPRPQMMDLTGGMVFGLLAAGVYIWQRRMQVWSTLDAATTLFAVMAVALGLSHLASGDAFGAPTRVPWAILLWGEMRHPSQVYETLAALVITLAVWPRGLQPSTVRRPGSRWWVFAALSAAARLFLETFRGDSIVILNGFREAQVLAWIVLAVSLWQIGRKIHVSPG